MLLISLTSHPLDLGEDELSLPSGREQEYDDFETSAQFWKHTELGGIGIDGMTCNSWEPDNVTVLVFFKAVFIAGI